MKLETVNTENKEKKILNDTNDLFTNIVLGKEVTEEIETTKGKFKVKFPRARDLESIGRILGHRLNGVSVQSIDPFVYNLMQQIASLDILVLEGPSWYENAKNEGKLTSWGDMPSDMFIQEVYAKAYEFRKKVQEQLEADNKETDREVATNESTDLSTDSGLFEGISSES